MSMLDLDKFIKNLISCINIIDYGTSIHTEDPTAKLLAMFKKDVGSILPPQTKTFLEGTSHGIYILNLLSGTAVKEIGTVLYSQFNKDVETKPLYFKDVPADFCSSQNFFSPVTMGIMSSSPPQKLKLSVAKSVPLPLVAVNKEALFTFFYADDIAGLISDNNNFKNLDRSRKKIEMDSFDWVKMINGPPETLLFSDVNLKQMHSIFTDDLIAEVVEKEKEPRLPLPDEPRLPLPSETVAVAKPMDTEPATVELESAAVEVAEAPERAKPPIKTKADPIQKDSDSTFVWLGVLLRWRLWR